MRTRLLKPANFSASRVPHSERSEGWDNPIPRFTRDVNPLPANPARAMRAWRVLHACDTGQRIFPLIEGELAIGMRPALVTPEGQVKPYALLNRQYAQGSDISLLTAWHDVRNWRKVMFDSDHGPESDVVHAHCFTAGMAGVRNFPAVVYDVSDWIEDHASDSEHTWLARSFHVAEQFVLVRAAAVVTRCESMRQAAIQRGTSEENVFVIPQAEEDPEPAERDDAWMQSMGIASAGELVIYAPDHSVAIGDDGKLAAASEQILAAFAIIHSEVDKCHLVLGVEPGAETELREALEAYQLESVHAIGAGDRQRAYASADIVIAAHASQTGISTQANPNANAAFAARRALLAADLPCNRDLSSTGRGCLWYIADDARDLAHRACFLARNSDFRRALADAGHGFYIETRQSIAVARQYDTVYHHAFARRKSGGQSPNVRLLPIPAEL